MSTGIQWTDDTWNPVVGCEYASPGCRGCYAARDAFGRLKSNPIYAGLAHRRTPDELPRFTGEIRLLPDRLDQPLRWKRPRHVFVNSMSDLFHPGVLAGSVDGSPFPFLAHVFATMVAADQHRFQVLTKRPQIMRAVLSEPRFRLDVNSLLLQLGHAVMPGGMTDPGFRWPANIWVGTSVENQPYTNMRLPALAATPAAVRFVSVEPMLESIDLGRWLGEGPEAACSIDWVIAGGESGPRARPVHVDWMRRLRDQAQLAGVAFFLKQWGEWVPTGTPVSVDSGGIGDLVYAADGSKWSDGDLAGCQRWWQWDGDDDRHEHTWPDGSTAVRVGVKTAGRLLDGRTWDELPA